VIGNIAVMLNKGAKGRLAEGVDEEGELYRSITAAVLLAELVGV
jgi:Mn-containing catalase